jgi:hypothetical protein
MSMRLWILPVLAIAVIVAGSGAAVAIPSLSGPTGIVSTPTAAVAPGGTLQAALSYQSLEAAGFGEYSGDMTAWALQALAGVSDKAELWAAYTTVRDGADSHLWGIGGKVQLAKEPKDSATLAVGAGYGKMRDAAIAYDRLIVTGTDEYTGDPIYGIETVVALADVTQKSAFIVATKDLTPMSGKGWEWGPGAGTKMLGSVGLLYLSFDPDLAGASSESLTRPFVNLEFKGTGGTDLGLEYRWKDDTVDAKAVFSAVLRHAFSAEVTGEVGTTNASPGGIGLDDQDWFMRLAYTFPLKGLY